MNVTPTKTTFRAH